MPIARAPEQAGTRLSPFNYSPTIPCPVVSCVRHYDFYCAERAS